MREGRVAGILPGGATEAEIMALATHGDTGTAAARPTPAAAGPAAPGGAA
jgi:hypothetical protein